MLYLSSYFESIEHHWVIHPIIKFIESQLPAMVFFGNMANPCNRSIAYHCQKLKIQTICLQHSGEFFFNSRLYVEPFDQYVCTGPYVKQKLKDIGYKGKVQYAKIDFDITKMVTQKKSNQSPLLLSTLVEENFFSTSINPSHFLTALSWVNNWARAKETKVLIKTHPRFDNFDLYRRDDFYQNFQLLPSHTALKDIAPFCPFIIAMPTSTTAILECMRYQIPIIMVSPIPINEPIINHTTFANMITYVNSPSKIDHVINRLTHEQAYREKLIQKQNNFVNEYFGNKHNLDEI